MALYSVVTSKPGPGREPYLEAVSCNHNRKLNSALVASSPDAGICTATWCGA